MTVVREFHIASGQVVADYPTVPDEATLRLRLRLIKEEYEEVCSELIYLIANPEASHLDQLLSLRKLLKELCDLRYVVEGTAVSCGLPIDEAYAAVHRSNMTKRWPGEALMRKDEGGKVMKGPDYEQASMGEYIPIWEHYMDEDGYA